MGKLPAELQTFSLQIFKFFYNFYKFLAFYISDKLQYSHNYSCKITCWDEMLQRWFDEYLTWNASEYGGVDTIRVPADKIWTPDLFISNLLVKLLTKTSNLKRYFVINLIFKIHNIHIPLLIWLLYKDKFNDSLSKFILQYYYIIADKLKWLQDYTAGDKFDSHSAVP